MALGPIVCQMCRKATYPRSSGEELCEACHKQSSPHLYGDASYKLGLTSLGTTDSRNQPKTTEPKRSRRMAKFVEAQ